VNNAVAILRLSFLIALIGSCISSARRMRRTLARPGFCKAYPLAVLTPVISS